MKDVFSCHTTVFHRHFLSLYSNLTLASIDKKNVNVVIQHSSLPDFAAILKTNQLKKIIGGKITRGIMMSR
jgi:hypothetical protein